ncbi:hypothetical protein [Amycolatopsis sp. GM8]|uniref:hypothetical protein n=1 Tax=Amycolatopsis sp. GM8 TaxID=2896530 RepID=UPI0035ABAE73
MRIVPVPYGHPDATKLIADVQQVYVDLYAVEDATPMNPEECMSPNWRAAAGTRG